MKSVRCSALGRLGALTYVAMLFSAVLVVGGCRKQSSGRAEGDRIRPVTLTWKGKGDDILKGAAVVCMNLSTIPAEGVCMPMTVEQELMDGTDFPVRGGDMMMFVGEFVFEDEKGDKNEVEISFLHQYRESDGKRILCTVSRQGDLEVGGVPVHIEGEDELQTDLGEQSVEDLRKLRVIAMSAETSGDWRQYKDKLAGCDPDACLITDFTGKDLADLLDVTGLRRIWHSGLRGDEIKILADYPVEVLIILELNTADLTEIGQLTSLKELVIYELGDIEGPVRLPEEALGLTRFEFASEKSEPSTALVNLHSLKKVRDLALYDAGIEGLDLEQYFPNLRSLSTQLSSLSSLPQGLASLHVFGGELTTDILNDLVDRNPDLYDLQLLDSDGQCDWSTLTRLSDLKILVVGTDEDIDLNQFKTLRQLQFLGIPAKKWEDDKPLVAELQAALPDCSIVPYGGICMGAGWIVFLIPFTAIFLLVSRVGKTLFSRS